MKKTTVFSIFILMLVSFSVPSYAGFRVPASTHSIVSKPVQTSDEKPDNKEAKSHAKQTGTFGIVSFVTGVVGCLMSLGILAILLGATATVFGILGMNKKRKLKGLAIAGMILGIIAIIGGIILL